QDPGRAEPALRAALDVEGVLERVRLAVLAHSLDGRDLPPLEGQRQRDAGEHRLPVDHHGARATVALVAALLGAGEAEAVARGFGQRVVRGDGALAEIAVALEAAQRGRSGLHRFSFERARAGCAADAAIEAPRLGAVKRVWPALALRNHTPLYSLGCMRRG